MTSIWLLIALGLLNVAVCVKVKVVMHSEQDDSKVEDEEGRTDTWERKKKDATVMPFMKSMRKNMEEKMEFEEEKLTEKPKQMHPNEMIFPLIYKQNHINSMFKFGDNWYTWSTEKRTDGSKATNYYICYDEPKHCDEIGWERTDSLPRCAFQIESLMSDDRACVNSFGVEPHSGSLCDGAEQMKVSDMVRGCGPRIRSLWRFVRVGRRPANAAKPADVNSLVCEDEEECYISIEYRIHHDRITFSLHEPTRGQTFKSALKREQQNDDENKILPVTERSRATHKPKKSRDEDAPRKKSHTKSRSKMVEGKGITKERDGESGYRRLMKNKIKVREDVSEDTSE